MNILLILLGLSGFMIAMIGAMNTKIHQLVIGCILIIVAGVLFIIKVTVEQKNKPHQFHLDYKLDLQGDSIYIITDELEHHYIHADSLVSFINQDNL